MENIFKIASKMTCIQPKNAALYNISITDWDFIKEKLNKVVNKQSKFTDKFIDWNSWAFLFFGVFVTTLVSTILGTNTTTCTIIIFATALLGIVCIIAHYQKGRRKKERIEEIIDFMNCREKDYTKLIPKNS